MGLVVKIDPLQCGWGKIIEIRRHVEMFKKSGKFAIAYLERAGEKEYFLASAFSEVYAPPSASLSLRGLSVSGTFVRGVLDKIGVEPEVKRIGSYKSAGDQLLRTTMSEEQREQLSALLDDIYADLVEGIAKARGKSTEQVEALLNAGTYKMEDFHQGGWVDGLLYEDEINELVRQRTDASKDEDKPLRVVGLNKYKRVGRSAFGLDGKKVIAVVRASGAIGPGDSGGIASGQFIKQLRALKKNKRVEAVVLRVDSPGGDALASDLMWREIQKLSEKKPVIASMGDVAASGGYYMSMACRKIVAEALTLTGSIGVVTGKFNLQELYKKAGYHKETLSKGKYAEMLLESRAFTEEERELFDAAAEHAYESFRDKAAASRGMAVEAMQGVAQGRVWSGKRAVTVGLVDAVGGVHKAVQLAKEAAGIPGDEKVRVMEVSMGEVSPLALLTGGGASASGSASVMSFLMSFLMGRAVWGTAFGGLGQEDAGTYTGGGMGALIGSGVVSNAAMLTGGGGGALLMEDLNVCVEGVASKALLLERGDGARESSSELFDC